MTTEKEKRRYDIDDDFIDDPRNFLRVEKALLDIEFDKLWIKTPKGPKEFKDNKIGNALLTYILLTRSVFIKEGQTPQTEVAHQKIAKRSGYSVSSVKRYLKTLETLGLIEVVQGDQGEVNTYQVKKLSKSNILYERTDDKGNMVHSEINDYIEYMRQRDYEGVKRYFGGLSKASQTVLDAFELEPHEISPKEQTTLIQDTRKILKSSEWTRGRLIDKADQMARQEKSIQDFFEFMASEIKNNPECLATVLDHDWLNSDETIK